MAYEPLYLAYLIYFNRDRDYFECHEVLEELWLEEQRDPLYKALLQVAVGLYHFRNSNVRGGMIMLKQSHEVLVGYPAVTLGIDLAKLAQEAGEYAARLETYEEQPFPYYDLTIRIVDPVLEEAVGIASQSLKPHIPQRRGPQRPDRARHRLE
jgi:predicted metal-dependent hydrolase